MDYAWLENGEYWIQVEDMRTSIMRDAITAKTEAQTAEAFQRQLYYFVRLHTGVELDFKQETPIKGGLTHDFGILKNRTSGRGRLDAVVNNLIIEYKKHSKLEKKNDQDTATNQVKDYLKTLFTNDGVKYNAILTDGIKISYFGFNGEKIESTAFKNIEATDIDRIIRAILTNNCKKFIPENVLKDFAVNSETNSISKELACELYQKLIVNPTDKTNMLFSEWESLMHLSFDDNGKGNDIEKRRSELSLIFRDNIINPVKEYKALFALQTAYAIIVKLIACKVIDKLEYGTSTKNYSDLTKVTATELQNFLEKLEDGYVYRSSNIINLLEGDFFSWYSAKEQWDTDLWETIIKIITCIDEYSTFSFEIIYEPVDIFKDLYMSIMPKTVRHSMGEYFTPAWLADYVVSEGLKLQPNKDWKAIDPCCGSGTFIIALIKKIVGNVNLYELSEDQKQSIKRNILSRVYGIDINPLSVLSARVGYYLALRPFGDIKDIEIPIYLGDSAITPTRENIEGISCYKYSIRNNKKSFDVILPSRFVEQKNFGKMGLLLFEHANGIDNTIIKNIKTPTQKSLGHSQVLYKDYYNEECLLIIKEMLGHLTEKLRLKNLECQSITLFCSYSKVLGGEFLHSLLLDEKTDNEEILFLNFKALFDRYYDMDIPVRKIGLHIGKLESKKGVQLDLFYERKLNDEKLMKTLDIIHQKFGKNSLLYATSLLSYSTEKEQNQKLGGHHV